MLLKRFLQCKKGVSEIIGSLIIILIVTIAGAGVYAYSLNAMSSSSDSLNQNSKIYTELAQERFEIIRVWSNNQQLNITILNYGQIGLSINAVYVNGTIVDQYISGKDQTVGEGQLATIEFITPVTIPSDSESMLQILVASQRGGKHTVLYQT